MRGFFPFDELRVRMTRFDFYFDPFYFYFNL
jgi:hypothetical protein